MSLKAIDLFAGPGGLSLGLKRAGFDIIAAVEKDPDAGKTYRNNIGNHTEIADITKFSPRKLRFDLENRGLLAKKENISLVAGGPPCPGFSLIGRSKIMDLIKEGKGQYAHRKNFEHRFLDDPRNRLFYEFVKYVKEFKPDYFIMENVSGMASYNLDGDPVIEVIQNSFGKGYDVHFDILSAADYGVPQRRKRIIFLGSRKGLKKCEFPKKTHEKSHITAFEAIRDLWDTPPNNKNGSVFTRETNFDGKGGAFRKEMRDWREWDCRLETGEIRKSTRGKKTCHWTRTTNKRDRVLFNYIKSGSKGISSGAINVKKSQPRQIYGDIYPSMWENISSDLIDSGLEISEESGRHYIIDPTNDKKWIMYPNRVFKDKMRRINPDEPSPTIVAHLQKDGYMFIHPDQNRSITVREAARFQSFPDSFEFKGSMTSQFRQVGNAVPPILAMKLGDEIRKTILSQR